MSTMNRHAKRHIEHELRGRFPQSDVSVDRDEDGGLRIQIGSDQGATLIAICGDEPSTVLAGLLACPERDGQ